MVLVILHFFMNRILLIDNFDSFTHILRESLLMAGADTVNIVPVNLIDLPEIVSAYDKVVISPGPGTPDDNNLPILINTLSGKIPVLGICLGMQAIVMAFGGNLINLKQVFHGETRIIRLRESLLFKNLPLKINVGLYHSWAAKQEDIPTDIVITSISEDNIIMSIEHKISPIYGVQFHPESYLTKDGIQILKNWLEL